MQLDALAAAEFLGQVGFRGLDAEPLVVGDRRDPAAGQHGRQRPLPGRDGRGRRVGDVRALGAALARSGPAPARPGPGPGPGPGLVRGYRAGAALGLSPVLFPPPRSPQ